MENKREYQGFDDWYPLLDKYRKADFKDKRVRKAFIEEFEEISRIMWNHWITIMDADDLAEQLATTWYSQYFFKDPVENFTEAFWYLEYASDRMNVSRWLRIRAFLNKALYNDDGEEY